MSVTSQEQPVLEKLGQFQVIRPLARGGMSEVYLARSLEPFDGPEVLVLKVMRLPKDVPADSPKVRELIGRLIEEGRLGNRLQHPAIARTLGIQRDPEQDLYFLVQEFIDGVTLGDLMDFYAEGDVFLPYGVVLRLIIPVLQALHYGYHEALREDGRPLRVVHRDIKPDNIMLNFAGEIRLVDFGVARSTSLTRQVTVGDMVVGTRHYMAPEQVFAPDQVGHRSDIFSLGLILFELCTLKPVFPRTRAVSEFANALMNFKPEDHIGHIDARRYPGVRDILLRLLQPEPKDRYASAGEAARDLMQLEARAPQQPTLAVFAKQLKDEIAEAEGAQTMMGEDVIIPRSTTERTAQSGVAQNLARPAPAPAPAAPAPAAPAPARVVAQPWDAQPARPTQPPTPAPVRQTVQPWDAPTAPRQAPAVQPWDAPTAPRQPSAPAPARPAAAPPAAAPHLGAAPVGASAAPKVEAGGSVFGPGAMAPAGPALSSAPAAPRPGQPSVTGSHAPLRSTQPPAAPTSIGAVAPTATRPAPAPTVVNPPVKQEQTPSKGAVEASSGAPAPWMLGLGALILVAVVAAVFLF